jgi:hypothetical protein
MISEIKSLVMVHDDKKLLHDIYKILLQIVNEPYLTLSSAIEMGQLYPFSPAVPYILNGPSSVKRFDIAQKHRDQKLGVYDNHNAYIQFLDIPDKTTYA